MTRAWAVAAVLVVAGLALASAGIVLATAEHDGAAPRATIGIHFSHFDVSEVTVRAGEPMTFTLENRDPVEHEWLVGDEAFHERHRHGTEAHHDAVPEEVTIPAFATRVTTVTFEEPGDYAYICHLPGHEQYGMRGVVHVVK
jgi:uncharacterized cupredoxin-like copper-binding protein